jgi:predicted transporter
VPILSNKETTMEYESLILGVLFSIGIFAAKSGVGLSYVLGGRKMAGAKAAVLLLFLLAYGVVFAGVAWGLSRMNLLAHLEGVQAFLRSGMIIHLGMAALMVIWGWVLLTRPVRTGGSSRGWVLLAVPCPVCVAVILFSAGFLIACFPEAPGRVVAGLYLAFVLVSFLVLGGIFLLRRGGGGSSESFLGGAMMLIAVYFIMSVTVMPQFADVEDVYRLAMNQGRTGAPEISHLMTFLIIFVSAFAGGFGYRYQKTRSLS